ncbi:MAG: beta-N-acetylhexosaminidase [Gemmatimonadota bacterium]
MRGLVLWNPPMDKLVRWNRPMHGLLRWKQTMRVLARWNRITLVVAMLSGASTLLAQEPNVPNSISVIPKPQSVVQHAGHFTLTNETVVWADAPSAGVARQLVRYLEPATGFNLAVRTRGTPAGNRIVLRRDTTLRRLGVEGYRLDVRAGVVTIRAAEPAGLFHGVQTIRQLLPPDILREAPVGDVRWTMPAVTIEDMPRYGWRGMHLDVARHFMPKEFVLKYIDLLALHKMNSFHWHLTDDQGWRLQIRKYPRLTDVGAWRKQTLVGPYSADTSKQVYDHERYGGFYTQADVREVVAYARERFVNIVPEIEMPGHAQAAIAAYPELGVLGDTLDVLTIWGVSENILKPSDFSVSFMKDVLSEVMELFPGRYIHIGGDEAPKVQWQHSAFAQSRMRELGLTTENELQGWFNRQMDAFLTAHHRRMIGWDEILEGGLAPNAVVMSWRGISGGIAAARDGHDVVMAPTSHTYFDYYQSRNTADEPLAIGGYLPLDTVYAYEPTPATLEPRFAKHILGAQGQIWTEYLRDPKQVEYMALPRMAALAEVLWTPATGRSFADFSARLPMHEQRLRALDVHYRPNAPVTGGVPSGAPASGASAR